MGLLQYLKWPTQNMMLYIWETAHEIMLKDCKTVFQYCPVVIGKITKQNHCKKL